MDEVDYWEPEGYTKDPFPDESEEDQDEEDQELPQKVRYATFQEENDFDPEP